MELSILGEGRGAAIETGFLDFQRANFSLTLKANFIQGFSGTNIIGMSLQGRRIQDRWSICKDYLFQAQKWCEIEQSVQDSCIDEHGTPVNTQVQVRTQKEAGTEHLKHK